MTRAPVTEALRPRGLGRASFGGRGLGAVIYAELRAEFVSLQRRPGEPISESELARSYGFSRTPVREAVLKLADEGLIEIFPQSGTFTARIPLAALPEAIVIRKALEETSAQFAARAGSRSQIIAILADPGAPARSQQRRRSRCVSFGG